MLLVASETGHVYTFATKKLQPVIMSENGKALIQTCLNSPDAPPSPHAKEISTSGQNDERMNPLGFEEPNLMYGAGDEKNNSSDQVVWPNEVHSLLVNVVFKLLLADSTFSSSLTQLNPVDMNFGGHDDESMQH